MENKWKSVGKSDSTPDITFNESPADTKLSVRSDWTMQRKVGVAMGIAGVMLFIVGLSPMILDSDALKGDLSAEHEVNNDPLSALLSGEAQEEVSTEIASENSTADIDLESDLVDIETVKDVDEIVIDPNPSITPLPPLVGEENVSSNALISEIDSILSAEQLNSDPTDEAIIPAPSQGDTAAINTNIGQTDTSGAAFGNGGTVQQAIASSNNTHAAAGINNISHTSLNKSGPEDVALIIFLVSLFAAGAIRYRKELF